MMFLLLACTPDPELQPLPEDEVPVDTGTPPETTPTIAVDVVSATCTVDPTNAVRATCTVTLSKPSSVAIDIDDGEESATFTRTEAALVHTVPLWGLTADTSWTFRASAGGTPVDGAFTTGILPSVLAFDPGRVTSGTSSLVQVAMPLSCGGAFLVVLDARGRVRWYQDFSPAPLPGGIDAFEFTEDGTFLGLVGGREIREVDLAGRVLLEARGFDRPLHHDITRRAGQIWTLMAESYPGPDGRTYVEDIVVTLDGTGAIVDRWEEHGHLDPTLSSGSPGGFWDNVFPDAIDAWHTNGLYVEDDGDFLISSKKESTLLFVSGGEVQWAFAGDGIGAAFPSDVVLVGGGDPTFSDQHHPRLLADGHLTVFDNGSGRGLELDLDPVALTASFVDAWPLGLPCPIQSSVFPLPDGHHLVACASAKVVVEFDADGAEVGRFAPSCSSGGLPLMVRAQPVDLWAGGAGGVSSARGSAPRASSARHGARPPPTARDGSPPRPGGPRTPP